MSEYKLIAARTVKGIKQQDLAKKLGISPQYLRLIEIGKAEPKRDLMIKIAKVLEVDVKELFF
jgi:putative transcriptional regulator